jgi:hypothetical protein
MHYSYEGGIDLDSYSFDEWVAFVFDHPVALMVDDEDDLDCDHLLYHPDWFYEDEWDWNGSIEQYLRNATQLFKEPGFLLQAYRPAQLRQGFWHLAGEIDNWIWGGEFYPASWEAREACLRAMTSLFEHLFIKDALEDTCFMWWDFFRTFADKPDPAVQQVMLEVMAEIIRLPSEDCWGAALHGLGHLDHPGKRAVIEAFMEEHPELDAGWHRYAGAAIEGKVL